MGVYTLHIQHLECLPRLLRWINKSGMPEPYELSQLYIDTIKLVVPLKTLRTDRVRLAVRHISIGVHATKSTSWNAAAAQKWTRTEKQRKLGLAHGAAGPTFSISLFR